MYPTSSETVPSRSMKIALDMSQQFPGGPADVIDRNVFHAAMIDRAIAEEARTAIDGILDDSRPGTDRTGDAIVGGAKNRDCRRPEGGSDMHRTGIVRNHQR